MKHLLLVLALVGKIAFGSYVFQSGNYATSGSGAVTWTAATGGGAVTVSQVGSHSGMIEAPGDKIFTLDQKAAYAYTINTLDIVTLSGTATVAVKINGTSVTGISAVSVSSAPATGTASAANSVAAGDKVTLVVSAGSSPVDMAFTVKYTR